MNQEELWRELISLPPEAQQEVMDLISFLRTRSTPSPPANKPRKLAIEKQPFIGMWRNREDMADSSGWVRSNREREWMP